MRVPFSVKAGAAAAVVLAAAVVSVPTAAAANDVSSMDRAFVEAAGHGGAYEVAAGQLAADRAADPELRSFGRRMVTDHTKAGNRLASLADDLDVSVPDTPDSVQRSILDIWSSLSGAAFDCSYAPTMYADHVAAVGLFEREAAHGRNSRLRAFARDMVPTLREHRGMAATNLEELSCGAGNNNGGPSGQPGPTWTPGPAPWPTVRPTARPTSWPTQRPTAHPTTSPTTRPRHSPTATPTASPTTRPPHSPTATPPTGRTSWPTVLPTRWPTVLPTSWPTWRPTIPPASPPAPTNVP
jgi:putative membrane protein